MLYLINIHWHRRKPEDGRPSKGHSTYPENARSLQTAKNRAVNKFNRHYGMHLAIDKVAEFQDPAGIFQGTVHVPAGSPPFRDCGRGHGHILMERGLQSASSH